jgi:hypothetical protein
MLGLAETQSAIAAALLRGDTSLAPPALVGGADTAARFAIHVRHYETSLRNALVEKFPASVWLLGTRRFAAAATAYVRAQPPQSPCIAEYGRDFPAFVAGFPGLRDLPYVESFVELDRLSGRASIAVASPSLGWQAIAGVGVVPLLEARVELQPGLAYLRADHPVDELLRVYLSGRAPDTFSMAACDARLEVYGARGALRVKRLEPAQFVFRVALVGGATVGDAASRALDADAGFDAGRGVRELAASGLVVALRSTAEDRQ